MMSDEQQRKINLKMLKVAKEFLRTGASIEEVASTTNISSSSVQRYLNDERIIALIGKKDFEKIQAMLKIRKQQALIKGGKNFASNNKPLKDENGKFVGSRKK